MIELTTLLNIAFIHLLAMLSPGPDFFLVTKNSLSESRKTGIWTALGLTLGTIIHVTYSLTGVGVLLSQDKMLFSGVQVMGGLFLLYIGYKTLKATFGKNKLDIEVTQSVGMTPFQAIRAGFITNLLNPKAGLYYISFLTQFIGVETSAEMRTLIGFEIVFLTFVFMSVLALTISHPKIKNAYAKSRKVIERFLGGVLMGLGAKLLFS